MKDIILKATNISILSRPEIEKLINTNFPDNAYVISFKDTTDETEIDFRGLPRKVFTIALDDLEYDELEECGLSIDTYFTESKELAKFIYAALLNNSDIICQCEYGQSRSAACAAAIMEVLYGNGISVFSDYRYYPNKLIYNKLVEELKYLVKLGDVGNGNKNTHCLYYNEYV